MYTAHVGDFPNSYVQQYRSWNQTKDIGETVWNLNIHTDKKIILCQWPWTNLRHLRLRIRFSWMNKTKPLQPRSFSNKWDWCADDKHLLYLPQSVCWLVGPSIPLSHFSGVCVIQGKLGPRPLGPICLETSVSLDHYRDRDQGTWYVFWKL